MKKISLFLLLLLPFLGLAREPEKIKIHGTVTDYQSEPIDSAHVILLSKGFQPVFRTMTDAEGQYSMDVPSGNYYAMAVVNMNHYKKSRLEFWAWNIPAEKDIRIDARYDKMEIYALNAFRPQGAYPSYILYFRPISLTRALNGQGENTGASATDISPSLDASEITVEINQEEVNVLSIQKVKEYVANSNGKPEYMYGYLIQTELPAAKAQEYEHFRVILDDRETGDKGEAVLYKQVNQYIQ